MESRLRPRVLFFVLAFVLWMQPVDVSNQIAFKADVLAQLKTDAFEITDKNTLEIVREISRRYDVPIGVEISPDDDLLQVSRSVRVKAGTLSDVLDTVFNKTLYKWEIADNVVNILPLSEHRDAALREVLETQLESFAIEESVSAHSLRSSLWSNSSFRELVQQHGLMLENEVFTSRDSAPLGMHTKTEFTNVSVKSLLNSLVKGGDSKYWIVNRFGTNKELLLLNL